MSRRAFWASVAGAATALLLLPAVVPSPLVLLWNASASVPIGLYAVHRPGRLHVGAIVVARPPAPLAAWLDARRSLPEGVPLVKPIAALGGQTVCRHGDTVSVDGKALALAQDRDHFGRPLPVWQGCHRLRPSQVFLMNAARPDSLDGRYFGPLPVSSIIGRATPLWLPQEP
ncbi:MAG TPA: S26 family signal peptidase [Stellaceae bacterium]|nr:S26 family signal peptidase [Stellaceae bacterium]